MAKSGGASVIELVGDISDENCVTNFAEQVKAEWGRVDVLVNNAGISCIVPRNKLQRPSFVVYLR